MRREINIQDGCLFGWLKERTSLTFHLTGGKSITGHVARFDRYCIVVETEDREMLLYKHALSGVVPKTAANAKRGTGYYRSAEPRRVAMAR